MRVDAIVISSSTLILLGSIMTGCGSNETSAPAIGAAGAAAPAPVSPPASFTPSPSAPPPSAAAGAGASVPSQPVTAAPLPSGAQNVPGVPCDVAAVVSESCTTCHGNPVKFQAPMPLMALADFQAASRAAPTRKVFEVIPDRINAADIKARMPPASGSTISSAGLKAFNDWLASGARAVTPSCSITAKAGSAPPPTGGAAAPSPAPGPGMEGTHPTAPRSGGASSEPLKYDDPLMKCYEFRAHADSSKTAPFSVSTQPDLYTNFTFMPPWKGMQYARSFRVLDGNAQVIHHWLLYKNSAPGTDGAISPSFGAHPDGELVHGWAPGGSHLFFDPDVGIEMPDSNALTLETHHNNTGSGAAGDNSGVEVCLTPTKPQNVASLSWLGTDAIAGTSASGTCAPSSNAPIHIIGVTPHMHPKGVHMSAEITRAGGKKEMLHDQPFDFAFQHSYNVSTVLMPGESIKTTCTYNAPANFGEGTTDEMCYLFTLYYPKLSLTNGNPVATLIHGANTCLQ